VKLKCTGGCHFSRTVARPRHHKAKVNLLGSVRRLQLRPGSTLQVSIRSAGTIGSVQRLVVFRHGRATDVRAVKLCQSPGARKPARHCAGIR
jgi:hypothetical protein